MRYTKKDHARNKIWESLDMLAMNINLAKDGRELQDAKRKCFETILYWAKLAPLSMVSNNTPELLQPKGSDNA